MAGQTTETIIDTTRRLAWEVTKEQFQNCEIGKSHLSPEFNVKIGSDISNWKLSILKFPFDDKIGIGLHLLRGDVSLKVEVEGIAVKSEAGYLPCESTVNFETKKLKKIEEFNGKDVLRNRLCATETGSKDFLKLFIQDKVTVLATMRFYVDRNDYIEQNEREKNFLARVRSISDRDTLSDFTVVCGDREFKCHRAILASMSTVFEAMLLNDQFVEYKQNSVTIEHATPDTVEALLEFLYNGDVPQNIVERAIDLIGLADKYDLQDLIGICESSLANNITVENVIESLIAVDLHVPKSQHRLKIIDFIKRGVNELVKSKDWKKFVQKYPDLVTEILLSAVNAPLYVSNN